MFYSTSDDDDGSGFAVGMPPSGSKLQSLFGADQSALKEGNESLMYVPPKQPKIKNEAPPQQQPEQKSEGPALMYACACHTFRYINGQYVSQGKLGLAVLGNFATKDYKLLIYASQKKAVTSAKISPTFVFKIQKDYYASFYDDQAQNWSVRFDTEEQLFESAKRVAISKYNITPGAVVTQDLNYQSTQEIQKGDTVEVQFTGWLHDGNNFGKVFDSNEGSGKLLKFRVGKAKVIKGWDLGILGMKKLSKRIVIVPPDLASGPKEIGPKIPPNCALIFQLDVTRVKFVNPQQDSDTVSLSGQMGSEASNSTDDLRDPDSTSTHELLTKSISDQLSSKPENAKSKLLERMSKMGQAIVPPPNASAVSIEDDIDEDDTTKQKPEHMPEASKPQLKPKPDSPKTTIPTLADNVQAPLSQAAPPTNLLFQQPQQPAVDPTTFYAQHQLQQQRQQQQQQQQLALYQSPQSMQAMFGYPNVPQMAVPQITSQQTTTISSTEMNLMLTDGRLKHTELKADLNRIVDKIDAVTSKISSLENANKQLQLTTPQQQIFNQAPEMEASVIMQNITRIIKENEKLRVECAEKTKKIELLNEKMTDLLTKNQQFFEKSNQLLANQTDSMQNSATQAMVKVSHLEDQNIRLQTELAALRSQLVQAHGQKDVISKNEGHLTSRIDTLSLELMHVKENAESANNLVAEKDVLIVSLQEKLKNGKTEQKQAELKLTQLQEENSELKSEKESFEKILNDVKKKRRIEKEKLDEEMEDIKSQHEDEIKSLRERYKKSTGKESEKIAKVEEELTQQYEEKMKSKIKTLEKTHSEALTTANDENDALNSEVKKLKQKLSSLTLEHSENVSMELDRVRKDMIAEHSRAMKDLNEKNEVLRSKLESVEKQKLDQGHNQNPGEYDQLLQNFNNQLQEIERLKSECDRAYDKGLKDGRATLESISKASYQRGKAEAGASPSASVSQAKIAEEVKKVMNSVFFKTKSEFEAGKQYDGKLVVTTLLNTIKEITLKMIANTNDAESEESEESEEESEDEDNEPSGDEEKKEENVEQAKPALEGVTTRDKTQIEPTTLPKELKDPEEPPTVVEPTSNLPEEPPKLLNETSDVTNIAVVLPKEAGLPEVAADVPGVSAVLPEVSAEVREVVADLPEVVADLPEVIAEVPEVIAEVPEVVTMENDVTSVVSRGVPDENQTTEGLPANLQKSNEVTESDNAEIEVDTEPSLSNAKHPEPSDTSESAEPLADMNVVICNTNESIDHNKNEIPKSLTIEDSNESFASCEVSPELNTSVSLSEKPSIGESDDDDYATDEGEDNAAITNEHSEHLPTTETKNKLVNELLETVESNQDILSTLKDDQTLTEKKIVNEHVESNVTSSASNSEENKVVGDEGVDALTKVVDPLLNGVVDEPVGTVQPETSVDDPLLFAKNDDKLGGLDTRSKVGDGSTDPLNSRTSSVTSEPDKKRNTLEDLGLDSSMFGVTKPPDSENVSVNDESKDDGVSDDTQSVTSKGEVAKPEASKEGKTSSKISIFDDDSDEDDLFSNSSLTHKVSPFVRSPPPLFDDDDDDVNWI